MLNPSASNSLLFHYHVLVFAPPQTAMTDVASKAANAVADTVKGAAKAVDPKQGEAAPMHGRTAIVTGGPADCFMFCAFPLLADMLLLASTPGCTSCARRCMYQRL